MSLAPVISPTGIVAPTYADILTYLQDLFTGLYGADIYLEPDSQDYQWLAILAQIIKDNNDAIIAAYNAFSPATAQGVGLSTVVKINGIRRLVASNSQAIVTIVGTVGTVINNGVVTDLFGTQWLLPTSVTIPLAGTIDVTATAAEVGAIVASPGQLDQIGTPTRGWQSVTNASAGDPGAPVETDAGLRIRQSVSTAIPALSVLDATLGAILNLVGVVRATIYENDTTTTDANGVPGHSISAVVEGGDAQTIAKTIALYKTPGTGTYGTTSETVLDPMGISSVINFFILTLVPISVFAAISAGTGYVNTTAPLIQESVIAFLNGLSIGQDSQLNKLWSPVNLNGDAATGATGQSQQALDVLSATYDPTNIYQARSDMAIVGNYVATNTAITVVNGARFTIGDKIALQLDDADDFLQTTASNVVGNVITMAAGIPGGKTATGGNLMYLADNIVTTFKEAASGGTVTVVAS